MSNLKENKRLRKKYRNDPKYREKKKRFSKVYARNKRAEEKIKAIKIAGGKCSKCGYSKCFKALEFHHPNPNKEDGISNLIARRESWEIIKVEIKKCILLCANCHRELHNKN